MLATFITTLSMVCYWASAALLYRAARSGIKQPWALPSAALAAAGHTYRLLQTLFESGGIDLSVFGSSSLVAWVMVVLLLLAACTKPVEKLGIVVFPVAALLMGFAEWLPSGEYQLKHSGPGMTLHILSSIIAFGLLSIGALQAVLLAFQDRQLRAHRPHGFVLSLPPLQTMESLLFQMMAAGWLFLSVSLLTGLVFLRDWFAQHLAHKTILSLAAWWVFGVLLVGRWRYGWRGEAAIRWTLIGFAALLLAYVGSKLVLEVILHHQWG